MSLVWCIRGGDINSVCTREMRIHISLWSTSKSQCTQVVMIMAAKRFLGRSVTLKRKFTKFSSDNRTWGLLWPRDGTMRRQSIWFCTHGWQPTESGRVRVGRLQGEPFTGGELEVGLHHELMQQLRLKYLLTSRISLPEFSFIALMWTLEPCQVSGSTDFSSPSSPPNIDIDIRFKVIFNLL